MFQLLVQGSAETNHSSPLPLRYTDDGLPKIIEDYDIQMKAKKKGFDVLNLSSKDKFQVLERSV